MIGLVMFMNQEKIGKLIKEIRKKNNLTQKQLANKYGVTYQAVSKWENGKNIPDISLIKQISHDFNINIEDILEGEFTKKKKKKHITYILIIALSIFLIIFSIVNKNKNFSFKTLSSKCDVFDIKGSIAYNDKKSSIYISDIKYCGSEDKTEYSKIECVLYEQNENNKVEISKYTYDKEKPITLDKFLLNLNFKINDYNQKCTKYTKNSLYLRIVAKDEDNDKIFTIPLTLNDNC